MTSTLNQHCEAYSQLVLMQAWTNTTLGVGVTCLFDVDGTNTSALGIDYRQPNGSHDIY